MYLFIFYICLFWVESSLNLDGVYSTDDTTDQPTKELSLWALNTEYSSFVIQKDRKQITKHWSSKNKLTLLLCYANESMQIIWKFLEAFIVMYWWCKLSHINVCICFFF